MAAPGRRGVRIARVSAKRLRTPLLRRWRTNQSLQKAPAGPRPAVAVPWRIGCATPPGSRTNRVSRPTANSPLVPLGRLDQFGQSLPERPRDLDSNGWRGVARGATLPAGGIGQHKETTNDRRARRRASGACATGRPAGGLPRARLSPRSSNPTSRVGSFATGEEEPEEFADDERLGSFARGQDETDSSQNVKEGTFGTEGKDSAEQ